MSKRFSYLVRIFFVFCFSILCTYQVKARVVGDIYSTDIMAYIDGVPIQSYNIGSKTAIVLEDLREYNFDVIWREDIRKLTVMSEPSYGEASTASNKPQITRGTQGKILGKLYSTDIVTVVNGFEVPSYNIGGKTVACIEDLGNIDTEDNQNKQSGYSKYAMNFVWDGVNRTVSLNTFKSNLYELEKLCVQNNIIIPTDSSIYNLHFKYLDAKDYEFFPLFSLSEDENKNQITLRYSVQLNEKEIKSDVPLVMRLCIDDTFNNSIILNYNINELEKIFKKENLENPFIAPSKEDIAKTIKNEDYKKILNEVTIDDCIYLLCYSYGTISSYCELIKIDNNANMCIYMNAAICHDAQLNCQKVYYTDVQVRTNKNDYTVKNKNEKVNLYCLNFDTKEISQIYSDYGIQVLEYFANNDSQTDIIKIQNNEGEAMELKLNDIV